MRLKTEVYYQSLFDVPVIPDIPEQSILNFGDDFYNNWDYTFVNKGTGRNYGVEMTLEKFFDRQYYFLLTASLFDSKYTPLDGIERRTKFAGNYAFNALFGYEWKLGEKRLLSVNTKVAHVGGKRDLPMTIDGILSGFDGFIYDYSQAYKKRLPDYFRADLNINMKTNHRRYSIEWYVDVNNITNHKNIWAKYYDTNRNTEEFIYQYGLMPIGGIRLYF
jgi:outer membrane receptor protein involved in Fe transport